MCTQSQYKRYIFCPTSLVSSWHPDKDHWICLRCLIYNHGPSVQLQIYSYQQNSISNMAKTWFFLHCRCHSRQQFRTLIAKFFLLYAWQLVKAWNSNPVIPRKAFQISSVLVSHGIIAQIWLKLPQPLYHQTLTGEQSCEKSDWSQVWSYNHEWFVVFPFAGAPLSAFFAVLPSFWYPFDTVVPHS